ncbi:MAG: DUF2267 domain-containing protein [Hyphomicrobiales bacterium]
MEELIGRIVSNVGIDENLAQKAVGMILGFLQSEGPADKVGALMGAMPGAEDLIASAGGESGGGGLMGAVGSLMGGGGGGGAMALMGQLTGAGLGMGDVQGVASEVVGFAKEKAGEDTVTEVISAIPGLSQFV